MSVPRISVCVVGLGYVGLPLVYHLSLADVGDVYGYDIDQNRTAALATGADPTNIIPIPVLNAECNRIHWSPTLPEGCDVYLVCVPTPDNAGVPDYSYVDHATDAVMSVMRQDSIFVLESTVAPGTVRYRLRGSMTRHGLDPSVAMLAFSPERINPGPTAFDEMAGYAKVVACDDHDTFDPLPNKLANRIYGPVFKTVYYFQDTRVAELAKCFENMQRDVNIALMNELSMVCNTVGISLPDVVKALRTKKSSPVFTSGLVGGHCIPVDPYYLAAYYDDVMPGRIQAPISGRRINEEYIDYIALLADRECPQSEAILIHGFTYKPDVNDVRNSGAIKIAEKLRRMDRQVVLYDPMMPHSPGEELTKPIGLVVGAVKHHRMVSDWDAFPLTIDCKFINIADAFPLDQLTRFKSIINM